jgi:hypothetical protein
MGKQNNIFILFTLFLISSVIAQTDSNQKKSDQIFKIILKLLEKESRYKMVQQFIYSNDLKATD